MGTSSLTNASGTSTLTEASQAEMEVGTETVKRSMSPLRVAQAIAARLTGLAVLAGNTFTGAQILSDQQVSRAMFIDCGYTVYDKGSVASGTYTIDYTAGQVQTWINGGTHTIATSNWPPAGNLGEILLIGTNLGSAAITWPSWTWVKPDGTTTTSIAAYLAANGIRTALQTSGVDQILLWSRDAGTTIYARLL